MWDFSVRFTPWIPLAYRKAWRAEGRSISRESHLLESKIEYDEGARMLVIEGLPTQLVDQLKRRKD